MEFYLRYLVPILPLWKRQKRLQILFHVSAVLHVSVASLKSAVTVPLCQGTLSCSKCQEDTDSQSVHMEGTVVSTL